MTSSSADAAFGLPASPGTVRIRALTGEEAASRVEALADLLVDCVAGGASVSFMWPLPRERALAFWRGVAESAARGDRVVLVAETHAGALLGTVQLVVAQPENQPHRADVAKMLVGRSARRQGIAARLLAAVDESAQAAGKTLLVLDTETGSDAERLYLRAGWVRAGDVPGYALRPGGGLAGATFFYKAVG